MAVARSTPAEPCAFDLRRLQAESFVKQVVFHAELRSTNDFSLELAARPDLETPVLVLAESQTAGRGRGSNRWWSQTGALTFSLILDASPMELKTDRWPRVSLAAALAVCQAVEKIAPEVSGGIRWPNDVHCAGRKICGILPELSPARAETPTPPRLVLGIGVNVNNSFAAAPPELRQIGVSLADLTQSSYDLTTFLLALLQQLHGALESLQGGDQQLADAISQRCLLQGRVVELQAGPRRVCGLCQGIDRSGALILHTDRGDEHFFGGVLSAVH